MINRAENLLNKNESWLRTMACLARDLRFFAGGNNGFPSSLISPTIYAYKSWKIRDR